MAQHDAGSVKIEVTDKMRFILYSSSLSGQTGRLLTRESNDALGRISENTIATLSTSRRNQHESTKSR